MNKKKFFFPIAVKLITIITAIILTTLVITTILITNVIRSDVRITAESNNFALNQHSASEAEIFINSIISSTTLIINTISEKGFEENFVTELLDSNSVLAAIVVPNELKLLNKNFFYAKGIDTVNIDSFIKTQENAFEKAKQGKIVLLNVSPLFNTELLALIIPLEYQGNESAIATIFSPDSLIDTFGSGTNKAILVNSMGDILVSSEIDDIRSGKNIAETQVFSIVSSHLNKQQQLVYKDENGTEFFTSFYKLLGGEAFVITQIEDYIVFEALHIATRRNIWLTLAVIFTAALFVWFFAKTISSPIQHLGDVVKQIEKGFFNVEIESKTNDEVSVLAKSIGNMSLGLAERERLKETFGKFINTEIAERAAKGELKLGGENREVTIFFTDLRSFTEVSEKMEPDEIVQFLNEYLEIMVDCVSKTGGTVDKFIGDAIMAVWGAPVKGKSPKDDALNAVTTALMMRHSLAWFNQKRLQNNLAPVKMGCGINSGEVVAGQIGSHQRMEYTVIGDTVNLASRIESINKTLSTDIIISEQTYNLVKEFVKVSEMPSFKIKGKDKPVRLFAVISLIDTKNTPLEGSAQPDSLKELWHFLGNEEVDILSVDINEEEQKHKIQD